MITLFSPAKLNLFFRVLFKRSDGFHEIASLYQAVSLGDELEIELAPEDRLFCEDPHVPRDASNLILQATQLFRKKTGLSLFSHIHLKKQIPMQAGLGGASSNAATVLWGLNELAQRPASLNELIEWASELGSDLAFFFSSGTAYCTGRGEQFETTTISPRNCWIAKPKFLSLSTPAVYRVCQPHRFEERDPLSALRSHETESPLYFNDLEEAAFFLEPSLRQIKQQLYELGFDRVSMTGSGSAFFCQGRPCQEPPQSENMQFFPAHFISRSAHSWYIHTQT